MTLVIAGFTEHSCIRRIVFSSGGRAGSSLLGCKPLKLLGITVLRVPVRVGTHLGSGLHQQ